MLQYYTGTQNGVLNLEVFLIQRFVIERSHCNQLKIRACDYRELGIVCPYTEI